MRENKQDEELLSILEKKVKVRENEADEAKRKLLAKTNEHVHWLKTIADSFEQLETTLHENVFTSSLKVKKDKLQNN